MKRISRLLSRRAKRAAGIELDWDPQSRREVSREQNRISDKILRDLGTYVNKIKDKVVQNGLSLSQALKTKTLKDIATSSDYNVRALANKLKAMIDKFIKDNYDVREQAAFKDTYGSNITDLLNRVQVHAASAEKKKN